MGDPPADGQMVKGGGGEEIEKERTLTGTDQCIIHANIVSLEDVEQKLSRSMGTVCSSLS